MGKQGTSSRRRERSRSSDRSAKRRDEGRSEKEEAAKRVKKDEKVPRKSRWEESDSTEDVTSRESKRSPTSGDADKDPRPPLIKDLLGDKEKMVEHLFGTISGTALQELIPDYLKNRSLDELKKLCFIELKEMSDDEILHSLLEPPTEDKSEDTSVSTKVQVPKTTSSIPSSSSTKQIAERKQEVEKSSEEPGREVIAEDAELLELEMRARAIRSLLRARGLEE